MYTEVVSTEACVAYIIYRPHPLLNTVSHTLLEIYGKVRTGEEPKRLSNATRVEKQS